VGRLQAQAGERHTHGERDNDGAAPGTSQLKSRHVKNYSGDGSAWTSHAVLRVVRDDSSMKRRANDCSDGDPQAKIDLRMQWSPGRWGIRLLSLLLFSLVASSFPAYAQRTEVSQPARGKGVLQATVTTQGTIPLGGVTVSVMRDGAEVANGVTDGDGRVSFDQLNPGAYSIVVTSQGFDTLTTNVNIVGTTTNTVALDLRISTLPNTVAAAAPTALVPSTGTLTTAEGLTSRELEELNPGGGLQSALRLLASVIEVPGGLAIKGGRPNQAATQLGAGAF